MKYLFLSNHQKQIWPVQRWHTNDLKPLNKAFDTIHDLFTLRQTAQNREEWKLLTQQITTYNKNLIIRDE